MSGRRPHGPAAPHALEPAALRSSSAPWLSQDLPLSPLDRWIQFLDRSTRAQWLFYLVLPVCLIAFLHVLSWACGAPSTWRFSPALAMTAVTSLVTVGAIHHTLRVAGLSLLRFRPALAVGEAEFNRHHHELTTTPGAALLLALAGGLAVLWVVVRADPSFYGMLSTTVCIRPALLFFGWLNTVWIVMATYLSVRYLGLIRRLHAQAPNVNLFERGPLFAFSRLSSRLALIFTAFSYAWVLAFPTSLENLPTAIYLLGINLPLILIIFIYPLYGMHVRMVEEKQRLLEDSARRIQAALAAFQSGPVPRAPAGVDPHRRLTSLIEEENYLRKIPTWPWEPGTLTAVLTAVFLPIMLVVAQQVIPRVMGE